MASCSCTSTFLGYSCNSMSCKKYLSMASICILPLIVTVIWLKEGYAGFIKVECKTEIMGQHSQMTLLECFVKTAQEVADPQIRVVTWITDRVEKPLLVFNRGKVVKVPGFSFAEPSWNERNMNISLLIANTAVQNEGVYTCMVVTNSGQDSSVTRLKVTAKYKVPTVTLKRETVNQNVDDGYLECNTDGGYPKGQLRWFDEHNAEWTNSAKMKAKTTESGLFELSSKLTLLKGSIFSKYTCVVFNASGGKEDEFLFEMLDSPKTGEQGKDKGLNPVSKVVAPMVVIGSLVIGLLLALLIYRRRSQQTRRHSATPLMRHHQQVPGAALIEGNGGQQEMDIKIQEGLI